MSEWTTMYNGVSLRDQFALRAPEEPDHNFKPTMPHPRPEFPPGLEFCEGCKNEDECLRPNACKQLRDIQLQQAEYREDCRLARWAQWPWYWADMVLKNRGDVE